jgi:glycosyltransferase involved in cell wall biosynthesis
LHVVYNPVRPLVSRSVSGAERSASATVLKSSPRPVIGLVGRISPQKRQHILLQAAARLKNRGIDAQIILLGVPREDSMEDAAYARSLRSSAQLLGLEADVEWTGYQTDPNPYYAMIDVLVMPSTASEGLPLAALEALQWGIPVVASPIGGIPEVISHGVNGLIVPPLDDQALAEALEQILTDPALRSRLQLGARATIGSRFSVATFAASIREIVLRLCETHPSEAKPERADQVAARV